MAWLPLALLLLAPARAGDEIVALPPEEDAAHALPAKDPSKWSVADYNDDIVGRNDAMLRDIVALRRTLARRDVDVDAFLAAARNTFAAGEQELRSLPAWKGDASLRDVSAEAAAWAVRSVDQECGEIRALMQKADVVPADLERAEALMAGLAADGERVDDEVRAVQDAFAKRHDLILVEAKHDPDELDVGPHFEAPDLVPKGSLLPAAAYVDFAVRYRNPFVVDQTRLVEAMNTMFAASGEDGDGMEKARVAAVGVARDVQRGAEARDGWFGDEALRDATRAMAKALGDTLEGPAAVAAKGRIEGFRKQKDLDRYNAAVKELNDATGAALEDWAAADEKYRDRWGIAAYEAWQAKHAPAK